MTLLNPLEYYQSQKYLDMYMMDFICCQGSMCVGYTDPLQYL